jgi:hypothetical protein
MFSFAANAVDASIVQILKSACLLPRFVELLESHEQPAAH